MAINFNLIDEQLIIINKILINKTNNKLNDCLSKNLWKFYENNSQTYGLFSRKIKLKNKLINSLRNNFESDSVEIYLNGSTANGFGTADSDIDLTFIIKDNYDSVISKSYKVWTLNKICQYLSHNGFELIDSEVIEAKVPILRYIDGETNIKVEININNDIGIRNTRLLYCYSKLDWRVVPICLAVKKWAKDNKIIDSFSGALSSYCIELMVIFYFQRCFPPILPSLQSINSELFNSYTNITEYTFMPDLNQLSFNNKNNQTLGQLFIGFFRYFGYTFDFTKDIVSVRLGKTLTKTKMALLQSMSSVQFHWDLIGVEEPFCGDNVGRTVYEIDSYNMIINGFKDMYMKSSLVFDCNCIHV